MSESDASDPRDRLERALLDDETELERIAERRRARRASRTLSDLRFEIRTLEREVEERDETIAALEALTAPPEQWEPLERVESRRDGRLPVAVVALASDWHTCELVLEHQALGNVHNVEIGRARAWRWARGVVRQVRDLAARADVRTLVIWLGGDFLVNALQPHDSAMRDTELAPPEETVIVRDLLAELLTHIRAELDDLVDRFVVPTSWGNHDRSTPRIMPGHARDFSHSTLIYGDLERWFAADDRVEFRNPGNEWNLVDVHGYGVLFHHGHGLRYGGGVGGLSVPLLRKVGTLRSDYDFRSLCIGHFHQSAAYGSHFTNGSLVGANGYSTALGLPSEPPAQVAFVIDLERLEVSDWWRIWGADASS